MAHKTKKQETEDGRTVTVYKSKVRGTWINVNDCTTEYDDNGTIVFDRNNRPSKDT